MVYPADQPRSDRGGAILPYSGPYRGARRLFARERSDQVPRFAVNDFIIVLYHSSAVLHAAWTPVTVASSAVAVPQSV